MTRPWLWLVAGVNGAGKTTAAKSVLAQLPFVNADEIAALLSPRDVRVSAIQAGREALHALDLAFGHRASVCWETTLSGHVHHRVVASARAHAFRIGLFFVGIASPALARARVEARVLKGGHDIPMHDIERRFGRTLANMPGVLERADIAIVFDNSGARLEHVLSQVGGRTIDRAAVPPAWFITAMSGFTVQIGEMIRRRE